MLEECLINQRRQQRFVAWNAPTSLPEHLAAGPHTPLHEVLNDELRQALEAAVQALPTNCRSVFVLREVEGLIVAETAQSLYLSEVDVKVRLLGARERLRARLADFAPQHAFAYLGPRCNQMVRRVLASLRATA